MRTCWPFRILCAGALLAASGALAEDPDVRIVHDQSGDLSKDTTISDPGFDLRKLTVQREGANKLEIAWDTEAPIPKAPNYSCSFMIYVDVDGKDTTGRRYGDMGCDLAMGVRRLGKTLRWEPVIETYSPEASEYKFHASKSDIKGSTASVTVSSKLFKNPEAFVFYGESLVEAVILDRIPDAPSVRWMGEAK